MSTSVSIVGLGLTEAILRIQAYTFVRVRATFGNVHILYSKKWEKIKCLILKHECFVLLYILPR